MSSLTAFNFIIMTPFTICQKSKYAASPAEHLIKRLEEQLPG